MTERKHKGSHKAAFPIGMLIVLLAAVGLVTIVVSAAKGINTAVEKSKNYEEYNTLLTPVVLIDPDNFDDITKADMSQLIDISIWSLLRNSDITPDRYDSGENGLTVPKEDVEEQFKKLFGTEITPVHATVEGYGYEFKYDDAAGAYNIPLTGVIPIYTPKVVDKATTSDTVVLTVACLAGEGWEQGDDGQMKEPFPDKYIKVTLREKDGHQYISAIQATTAPETATASPTAPLETGTEAPETQTEENTSKPSETDDSTSTESSTET